MAVWSSVGTWMGGVGGCQGPSSPPRPQNIKPHTFPRQRDRSVSPPPREAAVLGRVSEMKRSEMSRLRREMDGGAVASHMGFLRPR
ncbi:unnamed protein product [Arctogadus glacialis]